MEGYDHTQRGLWHWMMLAFGLIVAATGIFTGQVIPVACALLIFLVAATFAHLRVWDAGEALCARLGPVPLFGTRVPYADIQAVEPTRTTWFQGWGLHGWPGAWLVINIWGYDAVTLHLNRPRGIFRFRTLIIGTDEPEVLARCVRERLGGGTSDG